VTGDDVTGVRFKVRVRASARVRIRVRVKVGNWVQFELNFTINLKGFITFR
jgi:hypothetical protein